MSVQPSGRPRPRRRRSSRPWALARLLLALVAISLLLLLGISIGRALEEGPSPGGTVTGVRTLDPRPLAPAARTVTMTVTTG